MNDARNLRIELARRARTWAETGGAPWYLSLGSTDPVVLFEEFEQDGAPRHGNFHDVSYGRILSDPHWAPRLRKPHPVPSALPSDKRATALETDSCTSSDALLMNVLCHPENGSILDMLGVEGPAEFGIGGSVPKAVQDSILADETEIDAVFRSGTRGRFSLIIEAKLTEPDFKLKRSEVVESYVGLDGVFDVASLPRQRDDYVDYQLIRNVLAAEFHDARFVLLYDARRPDLLDRYMGMIGHVKARRLLAGCDAITWQALAGRSPVELGQFLETKYGIEPRR